MWRCLPHCALPCGVCLSDTLLCVGFFAGHDESGGEISVRPDGASCRPSSPSTALASLWYSLVAMLTAVRVVLAVRYTSCPRSGRKVKLFYGMSSATAMKKHAGAHRPQHTWAYCRVAATCRI